MQFFANKGSFYNLHLTNSLDCDQTSWEYCLFAHGQWLLASFQYLCTFDNLSPKLYKRPCMLSAREAIWLAWNQKRQSFSILGTLDTWLIRFPHFEKQGLCRMSQSRIALKKIFHFRREVKILVTLAEQLRREYKSFATSIPRISAHRLIAGSHPQKCQVRPALSRLALISIPKYFA